MDDLPVRATSELPKEAEIIVYCAHGVRSTAVARALVRAGYQHVGDMVGGMDAWLRVGLPVAK
jgi:rhodanese-related sulfurtransferase